MLAEFAAELEDRVLRALGRLHAARPRQSAIPRVHLAAALPDLANDALVAGLLDRLKAQGKVVADARTVALPGHEPKLSQGERKLKNELAEAIRAGGMSPPDAAELAGSAGAAGSVVPDLLALLRDEQHIVEINSELYSSTPTSRPSSAAGSRERLADGSAITMSELRDLLGTTRKYAVPIGEYLDRIGLTRREGDLRRLGPGRAHGSSASSEEDVDRAERQFPGRSMACRRRPDKMRVERNPAFRAATNGRINRGDRGDGEPPSSWLAPGSRRRARINLVLPSSDKLREALGLDDEDWQSFLWHARHGLADFEQANLRRPDTVLRLHDVPASWFENPGRHRLCLSPCFQGRCPLDGHPVRPVSFEDLRSRDLSPFHSSGDWTGVAAPRPGRAGSSHRTRPSGLSGDGRAGGLLRRGR